MPNRKRNKPANRCANFLTPSLGQSFEDELVALIQQVSEDDPSFRTQYLRSEFLTKFNSGDGQADLLRRRATSKWLTVDQRNEQTNVRLFTEDLEKDFGWATWEEILTRVRQLVLHVLGPVEAFSFRGGSHTNGASTRVRRGSTAAIKKHGGSAHVTAPALRHWLQFAAGSCLSSQPLEIVRGSVLFTVAKNADIDRVACKEPEINMFLQRSLGLWLEGRLRKKAGINLRRQERNQSLARRALDLGLATIDLSSASDSISRVLVNLCLPFGWHELFDDLRSQEVFIDRNHSDLSGWHSTAMFSSMGNGFTFQLETLLFWAFARAVRDLSAKRGVISVYGDDIIAPTSIAPRLARLFEFLGFKVNEKKSHWRGAFRESCGCHYYDGRDVSPFYLRKKVTTKTCVIRLLNRLLQWDSCGLGCLFTPEIAKFWLKWARVIPMHLHGGQDPEAITSLVSGDRPRSKLIERVEPKGYSHSLALDWWLTSADNRGARFNELDSLLIKRAGHVGHAVLSGLARGDYYTPLAASCSDSYDFTVVRNEQSEDMTWDPLELFPDLAAMTPVDESS